MFLSVEMKFLLHLENLYIVKHQEEEALKAEPHAQPKSLGDIFLVKQHKDATVKHTKCVEYRLCNCLQR